ncbi:MAG: response regulator [Candidatus Omnitrophica bacterium]|nr:response regulator [Candidatus Omnitrophota bacterium]
MRQEKVLIVDDDPDILDVLDLTLSQYFTVLPAQSGEEALKLIKAKVPDLILCDYVMPGMSGKDFCVELKKDVLLQHIPFIVLTGRSDVKDMVKAIEAGADDYIVKPFEPEALLAKIRMILRRTSRSLDANPLTHLPGNTSIMEELDKCIRSGKIFAVAYADLDKFKMYNDRYGFERGDDVIREVARFLIKNVREIAGDQAFIGHIGGDDFVFIADNNVIDKICEKIVSGFGNLSKQFYNKEDQRAGYIIGKDRQGKETKSELLSVSIGVVSNSNQPITHVAQIAQISAELKKYAKNFNKSKFVRDQRKEIRDNSSEHP